ncbi:DUF2007 domain-containing protein [Polycladidibacter hongkongensis]|uniref:putative signal transducing protein n=1 Tax=Polycladidibacter hongkongensis TaxID=1647556 RepID=UPI00082F8A2C|nr:DUF2007 domain-containing protein [Pseudovibrio hongkongensis]
MQELLRTNDPVILSAARWHLEDAGITVLHADSNTSILEGSLGFLQQRLLVPDCELEKARQILLEQGLGDELPTQTKK